MDEIMTGFTAFLEHESTRKHIDNIARSLSGQFQDHETEDIAQTVFECLLEKNDIWEKILATPSPWALIRKIVTNHLRDRLLSSRSESPSFYFRKRIVDCLRKAEKLNTFEFSRGKRPVICYAFRSSGIPAPCHIDEDMIRNIPFHGRHPATGIKSTSTEKGIVELAVYFLDFMEKEEGRQLSVQIDSLWMWIISSINISDVFADHQHSFDGLVIQPDMPDDDVESSGNNPEQIGYSASCDHVFESDIHLILEKVLESLDETEKQCLSLFFENRKLGEIASETGHKGASGAKYVFDKSIAKIKKILEDSGYDCNWKDSSTFEKDGAFFVYLKEALKNSD